MASTLPSPATGSDQTHAIGTFDDVLEGLMQQGGLFTWFSVTEHNSVQSYTGNRIPRSDWNDFRETADAIFEIEGKLIKFPPQIPIMSYVSTIASETWYYAQKTTDVTSEIESTLTRLQQNQHVEIPHSAEIRDYLLLYPDMTDRLLVVCETVRRELRTSTTIIVRVIS